MTIRKKYTQQFKEEAVELVVPSGRSIAEVAVEIGVVEGTLGNWVRKYRATHPDRFRPTEVENEPVSWAEHCKALAEIGQLKQEIEFLGKVSAFFAAKQL